MGLPSLERIEDSHRRHDGVLESLLAAARRLAAGRPDPGDVDAVHAAVTFLEDIVPRHFLDEEGSIFPRLSTRRPELAGELAQLSAEHPTHIALQSEVAAAARGLADARPANGKALLDAATRLADAHRAHRARKDEIFRAASQALTAEDDVEIFAEMTTRRDRDDGPAVRPRPAKAAKAPVAVVAKSKSVAKKTVAKAKPKSKVVAKPKPKAVAKPTAKKAVAKPTAKAAKAKARPKAKPAARKPARRSRR